MVATKGKKDIGIIRIKITHRSLRLTMMALFRSALVFSLRNSSSRSGKLFLKGWGLMCPGGSSGWY
jgi:hypothetical protein